MTERTKTLEDLLEAQLELQLTGVNGNAFVIIGACSKMARKFGCSKAAIDRLRTEMMSGDYNNVLTTAGKYFDVY